MDKKPGHTIDVSRFQKRLSELDVYAQQFDAFYCTDRQFSENDLRTLYGTVDIEENDGNTVEVKISVFIDVLKIFIDSGRLIEGLDVSGFEQPIIDILKEKEILFGKLIPPNFIVPLYDLIKFKRSMMQLESLPMAADEDQINMDGKSPYLERVIQESDRYKSILYVKFQDGGILFFPGRLFSWTDLDYLHEGTLMLNRRNMEQVIARYMKEGGLRQMSENERKSKINDQEAEVEALEHTGDAETADLAHEFLLAQEV